MINMEFYVKGWMGGKGDKLLTAGFERCLL